MAIDADQLDQQADAEFAALTGQAPAAPAPADDVPPPAASEPVTSESVPTEAPAPAQASDNWQDKYHKAEESRKNAQALMTQATQKTAELERSNDQLRQELNALKAQLQASPPATPQQVPPQPATEDEFKELRNDYEDLDPVFNELEAQKQHRQKLEDKLARLEQTHQAQEHQSAQEQFWAQVREVHPDLDTVMQSQDFQGWFSRQSQGTQQMSQVSPEGAAHVMTLYKQSGTYTPNGAHSPSNKMQQAQALTEPNVQSRSTPSTQGGQPRLTLQQIAALPQSEYNKNEAEYDKMMEYWVKQGGR